MKAIISSSDFEKIKKGTILRKNNNSLGMIVSIPNCGGPGKYPTHLVECLTTKQCSYIFHDGKVIRYSDQENKEHDGAIVGDLCT